MMDEPTDETRRLALTLLDALLEWDPRILEATWARTPYPNRPEVRERGLLAHRLQRFLSEDPSESANAWEGFLRQHEPEANVSGGPGDAVPQPGGRALIEATWRAELRALAVEDERVNPGAWGS